MIDGIKLLCNINPDQWTNNKNLSFRSWTDTETGEVANNNKHANINGLHLSIIQREKDTFCNVRGSLPKYYTNGETNAIDYNFSDFLTTCEQLQNDLKIHSNTALLRGFEFGVNINIPFDFSDVLECVKSYKMHAFGQYIENGKPLGIVFDFQQYKVKIYDKGLQETGKKSRLMRLEIGVKKMNWVKHLNIKTLSDLQNTKVWTELSKILLSVWNEIIFIDKSLKYRLMTNHQQKKYIRFFDPFYWCNLNKNTYYKAKNDLNKLQCIYEGKENTKQSICDLIAEKCQKLTTETIKEIGDFLTEMQTYRNTFRKPKITHRLKNENWRLFNPLDKGLIQDTKPHTFLSETTPKKIRQKSNVDTGRKKPKKTNCMNCKKSLEEKKPTAKFCGLKCKNQYNGKLRTKANQKKRQQENKKIGKILKELPKTDLSLLVIYRTPDGLQYADQLKQSEIKAPPEWIRQIKKVVITDKTIPPPEFTTVRAKRIIRTITKINSKI
ncbi:hypothetical protein HZQ13_15255 [Elizabethkingia anophelis]|nr:hypothetical protein [Elizabethkingia anophelis]